MKHRLILEVVSVVEIGRPAKVGGFFDGEAGLTNKRHRGGVFFVGLDPS